MSASTRKLVPGARRAAFAPASVNSEARTVDVQWTTGERVLRYGWDGPFYEELSMDKGAIRMDRLTSGRAPFLANHDAGSIDSVIGIVESATPDTARVRFAKNDPAADSAWNKVEQGILPNVSVGYRIYKAEQVGTQAQAEGGRQIPVYRVTDWEPIEISLVPIGADSQAFVRASARAGTEENEVEVINRAVAQTEQSMDEQEKIAAEKAAEAKRAADTKAAADAAVQAERARISEISTLVQRHGLTDLGASLVAGGATVDQARAQVLEALATRSRSEAPNPAAHSQGADVTVGEEDREKFVRGAVAGLMTRADTSAIREAIRRGKKGDEGFESYKDQEIGGPMAGIRMLDLARSCLDRAGIKHRHIYNPRTVYQLALRGGSFASTSDFPVALENLAQSFLRPAYAIQDDTWRRVCATDVVADFRSARRYLAGAMSGQVPTVGENEEYTQAVLPDSSKTLISTEKRGEIIGISYEALVNDDLGMIQSGIASFGRKLGRSIELAFYAELAKNSGLGPDFGGVAFFHANYANISTSAALSIASLDADRLKMRQQKDPSGSDYLDLNPSILLVPVGLETAANTINTQAYDPAGGGALTPNPVRGRFQDIVSSPRLDWSATRRYLFAGKGAFVVVFLEGSGEGPQLEQKMGFEVDGMRWKARLEYKVNAFDPKLALTNTGT